MITPTIAVTGASGHLGLQIVQELLNRDYKVRGLYQDKIAEVNHPNLTWIKGDITHPSSIKNLLTKTNVVIHAAGLVNTAKTSRAALLETNVLGTQNIVDYCTLLDRSVRLIHISSTSAVTPTKGNKAFKEQRPYVKDSELAYAWSKSMAEQLVVDAYKNKELDVVIVRPSAIIGPPDYKPSIFGKAIIRLMKNQLPALTTGGYNFVDVRDVSRSIVNSLDKSESGEIYNLGGQFYSIKKICQIVSKLEGVKIPKVTLNINLFSLFAPILSWAKRKKGYRSSYDTENLYFLRNGIHNMDSSKAERDLDHQSRPIEQSLKDLIEWFKENGHLENEKP